MQPRRKGSADSRIISGSGSVVPVSVEAGEVIVDVSINGRGPFPLMFDTGAEDAVTPEIAVALGLKTEGVDFDAVAVAHLRQDGIV
jgi:hypothetical protein